MSSFTWRKRPQAPPIVPTDTVIPVHHFDDGPIVRSIAMYFMMKFDDVLDAEAIKKSLETLLSLDGWRKLGARIRLNANNKLEYHVPAQFNDERPAIMYRHEHFDISVKEHPVASKLPQIVESDVPLATGKAEDFLSLMLQDGDPTTLDDWLYSDLPLLGLRIVSFNDATLVTISWSHIVLDGMGRKELLDAWSLVLQGREKEVLPFHGVDLDPLATLGTNPREEYKQIDKQMSTWQLLMLAARHICFKLWSPPSAEESRVIMVPASFATHLRDTAMADISAPLGTSQQPGQGVRLNNSDVPKSDENQKEHVASSAAFVSEGDVICAWWTRIIVAAQLPPTSNRTVAITLPFNLRWLLKDDLLPSETAYIGNAAISVPAFTSVKELLEKPLGQVAAMIRSALQTLGTRDQVEALVALSRAATSRGSSVLFGDAWMQMIACTNWTKGKFFQVDFSSAVLKGIGGGKPTYIQAHAFSGSSLSMINAFSIVGKDAHGNIWLIGRLASDYWPIIEDAMAKGTI